MSERDDFTRKVVAEIALRVAYLCSKPDCRCPTVGPTITSEGNINVGVAAHITAAAAGGPRYGAALSPDERRHPSNGIWLCQTHAKLIDSDAKRYTVELLRKWKISAEQRAFAALATGAQELLSRLTPSDVDDEDLERIRALGLALNEDIDVVTRQATKAAMADLATFKRVETWPVHAVALNLRFSDEEGSHVIQAAGLARALHIASAVRLVAGPGTGKSTTLVQLAEAILNEANTVALVVPLGEWAASGDGMFRYLLHRNAFQRFREQHFMFLAFHARLVLLLDGWNELDAASRLRAMHALKSLRRDYPLLRLAASTRRQVLDIPLPGPLVEIEDLSEDQQLQIARAQRGEEGVGLIDQAWRTPGIRELIAVPLYLNALLAKATSSSLPDTKEAVLRLFVTEYESVPERAITLNRELSGCHRDILRALAVQTTLSGAASIDEKSARRVVSDASGKLLSNGQIGERLNPGKVLDVLVDQHILLRLGADLVAFQHQQFQEWYASFEVEELIQTSDPANQWRLKSEVLNMPAWEEPILFCCERLSRQDETVDLVANAICAALSIDPILAAEMIFRSTTGVWKIVEKSVLEFVDRWHKRDAVDRAVNFMITTGRNEFSKYVWPLITHRDSQVHLRAFRSARRFRPSVLGPDVRQRLAAVPIEVREHALSEIAHQSGYDGIELATALAMEETNATVQVAVIEALDFRRADRHVAALLRVACDEVWSLIAKRGIEGDIPDPVVAARLARESAAYEQGQTDPLHLLASLIRRATDPVVGQEVRSLLESAEFPIRKTEAMWVIRDAASKYPHEVAAALIVRLENSRLLPLRGEDLLGHAGPIDAGPIVKLVLESPRGTKDAEAAAMLVGADTVRRLIASFLAHIEELRSVGRVDDALHTEHYRLRDRIRNTNFQAFRVALLHYRGEKNPSVIAALADLLASHGSEMNPGPIPQTPANAALLPLLQEWAEALLSSSTATRQQFSEFVRAVERIPFDGLTDYVRRLLIEDITRLKGARAAYFEGPARGRMDSEASTSYSGNYRNAFIALGTARVAELMQEFLVDPEFGLDAAHVLKQMWRHQQGVENTTGGPDYSTVPAARRARQDTPSTTSYAEDIFCAVRELLSEGNEESNRRALELVAVGLSIPHGDKAALVQELLRLPSKARAKQNFLTHLVLAGYPLDGEIVLAALTELMEEAKAKSWLLDENRGELSRWLELLVFSSKSNSIPDVLRSLNGRRYAPWSSEGLLSALAHSPEASADDVLFELARIDARFYEYYGWLQAVIRRNSASCASSLVQSICEGALARGDWSLARSLAAMMQRHPAVRANVIGLLERDACSAGRSLLLKAVAEIADVQAVETVVRGYARENRSYDGVLYRALREVALGREPLGDDTHTYEVSSVDISELRKSLFAMLKDGGASATVAKECLIQIDELRDEYGKPLSEPRHPDVFSQLPWPQEAPAVC